MGSIRSLSDANQTLSQEYSYTPYGKLKDHNGTSENSFLYTGEQLDQETDDYYLRARYYSPNSARFLSRDTYDGTAGNPITQNHYLYTGSNPTRYTDPSGHFFGNFLGTISLVMRSMVFAMPRMVAFARPALVGGSRALPRVLPRGATATNRSLSVSQMSNLLTLARLAARFGADSTEGDSIPIQVYGYNNLPEHQDHIFRSMLGLGSNSKPTSAVLTRVGSEKNDRNFLGRKKVCGGHPRPDGKHCDEYPYNSSLQGGTANFDLGNVSVRLVDGSESRKQGGFISKFYRKSPVGSGDNFLVIPLGGVSGFFDKKGMWHEYK